jgi:hypothetical protein
VEPPPATNQVTESALPNSTTTPPAESIGNGGDPVGYTRLNLEFTPCFTAKARDYPKEQRGFLKQWLAGKEIHKELSVKATIDPIGVSQTRPLVLVHRDSSTKGEAWNTEIGTHERLTRYFLVDNGTLVSLEFSFSESSKYTGSAVGTIFQLIQNAVGVIEPASTLITKENKEKFNAAAGFVDQTINGLMATDLKEKTTLERRIGGTDGEKALAHIVLFVPDANSTVRPGAAGYQPVGMWTIKTERILSALFGQVAPDGATGALRLVSGKLSAPIVMNFRVDDDKTLGEYLSGNTSVSAAKDAYLKDNSRAGTAEALCSAVAFETGRLGFSPADVGGAVWAYAKTVEPVDQQHSKLQTACSKIERYPS